MVLGYLQQLIRKLASEVHRSKIDEFEKRILEMEKKHDLILKSINDNQNKLDILDSRIYNANLESAKALGALNAIIQINSNSSNINFENKAKRNGNNK